MSNVGVQGDDVDVGSRMLKKKPDLTAFHLYIVLMAFFWTDVHILHKPPGPDFHLLEVILKCVKKRFQNAPFSAPSCSLYPPRGASELFLTPLLRDDFSEVPRRLGGRGVEGGGTL